MLLALDEGLAGLALSLERVEALLQAFLGRFAGIDGATLHLFVVPKKRGPDHRAPVMCVATLEIDVNVFPR